VIGGGGHVSAAADQFMPLINSGTNDRSRRKRDCPRQPHAQPAPVSEIDLNQTNKE